jgi:hypothetical protein
MAEKAKLDVIGAAAPSTSKPLIFDRASAQAAAFFNPPRE